MSSRLPLVTLALVASVTVLGAVLFATTAGGAAPRAASPCTKLGTAGPDAITGTDGPDFICARAGADYVHAQGGSDTVLGEAGADTLVGGGGRDDIRGGDQDDQLFSTDQVNGNDKIDGGAGFDRCYADPGDNVRNCENVTRGSNVTSFMAMDSAFGELATVAEGFQNRPSDAPSPPQCTPPPEDPPPTC